MKIWLPLAILLSVGWLLLVAVVISRGGDGVRSAMPLAGDAATLLRQSQAAMREVDSLQLEMTMEWEGREDTYRVVWQSPDSFHVLAPYVVAHMESGRDTEITDLGVVEAIAIDDRLYVRPCARENEDCEAWQEGLRDGMHVPALAGEALDPFWAIELLGLVTDAAIIEQENVGGVACARLQGRANIMRAMLEASRRAEEMYGPLDWGEECAGGATEPGGETQEECRSLTLEEFIAANEDSLREQDENPFAVELWIGRDDRLMRRLEIHDALTGESQGSFSLSRFNEVTVEPPK